MARRNVKDANAVLSISDKQPYVGIVSTQGDSDKNYGMENDNQSNDAGGGGTLMAHASMRRVYIRSGRPDVDISCVISSSAARTRAEKPQLR